ncbi:MAG: hypothetical protein Q9M91_08195 [Candidatus Dojkabacteria bacterium]|nr:hypothetical protein [Candidatus Dojkabacteria bacterium]
MKALDLKSSPGHIELFLTENGPKIIEIGARIGGYRNLMYLNSSGTDMVQAEIDSTLSSNLKFNQVNFNNFVSAIELFPNKIANFIYIKNIRKLNKLDSLKSLSIHAKKGDKVGKASEGFKSCCNILLVNEDKQQLELDEKFIKDYVKVITN